MHTVFEHIKFFIWRNIHKFPSCLVRAWQWIALRRIVRYAYGHTNFYRHLWENSNVSPKCLKTFSDWKRFPVIDRMDFFGCREQDYISKEKFQTYTERYTSGTTARPFRFLSINNNRTRYASFLCYRFLYWLGWSPESILKKVPIIRFSPNIKKRKIYRSRIGISLNEVLSDPETALEEIIARCPLVIEAYPSVLMVLAKTALSVPRFQALKLRYVVSSGEHLSRSQRRFIEKAFGCEMYDRYGMEEFWVIGTECRYHDGVHINVESFFVEIVDEYGTPVPIGEKGRIVITDFRNFIMPFVRYDTGDQGFFVPSSCRCGLSGPRLKIDGRRGERVTFRGKRIYHFEFGEILERFAGSVLQYQTVKQGDTLTVSLVCQQETRALLCDVKKAIEALVGEGIVVNVEYVSSLVTTARGKSKILINKD